MDDVDLARCAELGIIADLGRGEAGVEVSGIDLGGALDDATFGRLKALLLEHCVVVVRAQKLEPSEQVALGRPFGPIEGQEYARELRLKGLMGDDQSVCIKWFFHVSLPEYEKISPCKSRNT